MMKCTVSVFFSGFLALMIYFSTGALVVAAEGVVPERMALWSGAAPVGRREHGEADAPNESLPGPRIDRPKICIGDYGRSFTGASKTRNRARMSAWACSLWP